MNLELSELEDILHRMPIEDLKLAMGNEVYKTIELVYGNFAKSVFDKPIFDKSVFIKAVLKSYGKEILKNSKLRTLMLTSKLNSEKIENLASSLNIKEKDDVKKIIALGEKAFARDEPSKQILESLGLPAEKYLPDEEKESAPNIFTVSPKNNFYELLDYQNDIRLRVLRFFRERKENMRTLVHMPTGTGKTKTAMHILKDIWYQEKRSHSYILWLAHSKELLEQAIETFQNVWEVLGHDEIQCVRFYGDYEFPKNLNDNAYIFAGVQKLIFVLRRDKALLKKIKSKSILVVLDEAHKAPARETARLLRELMKVEAKEKRSLLGLTATPGRSDDYQDAVLQNLFERSRYSIDLKHIANYLPQEERDLDFEAPIEHLQHRQILSSFERQELNIEPSELSLSSQHQKEIINCLRGDKELPKDLLEIFAKNRNRNQKILDAIRKARIEEGLTMLVFACNVIHAKMLSLALNLQDIENGLILGETPIEQRNEFIKRYKDETDVLKILINVDVLTTGFDAPNTNSLLIARPVASLILYSQILGRGLRGKAMGGSDKCTLIQVIDKLGLGDEKWAYEHFNNYWT